MARVLHHKHGDKVGEDGEGGKALSKGRSTDVCTHTAPSEERQRHRGGHNGQDVPIGGCEEPHSEGFPAQARVPEEEAPSLMSRSLALIPVSLFGSSELTKQSGQEQVRFLLPDTYDRRAQTQQRENPHAALHKEAAALTR